MSRPEDIFTVLNAHSPSPNKGGKAAVPPAQDSQGCTTTVSNDSSPQPEKVTNQDDIFVVQGYAQPTRAAYAQGGPRVQYNHQSTTVVVTSQPSLGSHYFTEDSVEATCPKCNQVVVTRLYHQTGSCTYLSCIVLGVVGFAFACCLLPFFCDRFKDVVHSCPKCRTVIGIHNRI